MKSPALLFPILFLMPVFGFSQSPVDSAAVAGRVDSLIQASRALTGKKEYDKALEVNATGETLAIERFGRESAAYGSCCFNRGRVNHFKKNYQEAEKWYLESKSIREKTLGKEHPDYEKSLNNLRILYREMGAHEKAEPLYLEARAIREKILGKEHPDYASILNSLGNLYHEMGAYEKAEPPYLEAKAIREKTLGKEHPDYASILNNLGVLYREMGAYEKAESLHLEAKAIREKTLGKEHLDYASSLNDLGGLYLTMGAYEKAEPFYLEAKAITEKTIGKEHSDYAMILDNLGTLYKQMGAYEKAEPLSLEARAITEKTLGKEHPDYASSLNNLGNLYYEMGAYEKAEPLHLEAKAIRGKNLGKEHPDYASSLINLGMLYTKTGAYEKAEPLYLEAKAIKEKTIGKEHPDYASSLNSMGVLYHKMGAYEKAEPFYLESRAIREKNLGKEHPDYVSSLNNLGVLYTEMGAYEKAEPLHLEAKAITEKTIGKEHSDYAKSLGNLGSLYFTMGAYEKAEPLFLEARAILEINLGKEHPDYAASLHNIGSLYRDMGAYEKAEPLFLEAKAIREKNLGKEHPDYAMSLLALFKLYETQNRVTDFEPLLKDYAELRQSLLSKSATFLSERELAAYAASFQQDGNRLFALLYARLAKNKPTSKFPQWCFDHVLFQKGFLLGISSRLNTLASFSPASQELNLRLKSYRRRLAAQYAKPIAERKNVPELEEKANTLEKEFARTVAGYAEAMRQVHWQEVQQNLKAGEAAIEFVHFPHATDSILYAALLLRPGDPAPHFIPLFDKRQLDTLLFHPKDKDAKYYLQDLYAADRADGLAPLWSLVWKPIEPYLISPSVGGGRGEVVKTVYLSPSGDLHRINFAAISPEEGKTLAEQYRLVPMNSTRYLVTEAPPEATSSAPKDAVLFGDIHYDLDTAAVRKANAAIGAVAQDTTGGKLQWAARGLFEATDSWAALKGSKPEIDSIGITLAQTGFRVVAREGDAATEEAFKQIGQNGPSPRILHVSTHGYFFPDPETKVSRRTGMGDETIPFKASDHPMIRSGLILAGANYAWKTGRPAPQSEDGILTAYEVAQMNLQNTELVVLSACETGLGDIKSSEGVYGLQRAFKIAGAKYLLMSLWQVPEEATTLLMTRFYHNWLDEKMPMREALEAAQTWLRGYRTVYDNPYFWAGFVLVE